MNSIEYANICATKAAPMTHHKLGLTWTASGYGARIPTVRMVKVVNRWHRVYVAQYGNCGTSYIVKGGRKLYVRDSDLCPFLD